MPFRPYRLDQLEYVNRNREPKTRTAETRAIRGQLGEMPARKLPDETISSLTFAPDLELPPPGNYVLEIIFFARLFVDPGKDGSSLG
jgi:hypothetical protein